MRLAIIAAQDAMRCIYIAAAAGSCDNILVRSDGEALALGDKEDGNGRLAVAK